MECFENYHFGKLRKYTRGKKEIHPYYISPIEMRSLWMEIKCVKSATRLLDRIWVNKGGLDLSKEVLWVSVGQRAAVLQAVKVGGQKKFCRSPRFDPASPVQGWSAEFFFDLQLWQPIKLLPSDLQRPTVPLWKDLNLFCWLNVSPRV